MVYVKNVRDVVSALKSGKRTLSKQIKISIAAIGVVAVSFLMLMLLTRPVAASTCGKDCGDCDGCVVYEVEVDDIIFERVSDGDPTEFCEDERVRVSAIVAVDDVWCCAGDPEVRAELYVDGEYYGSARVEVSPSIHRRVDFSRIIYTSDFPISSSVEVKVVAKTCCAEDERVEHFYVKDCEDEDCWCCDVDWEYCRYDYCECGTRNYGRLKVKVKDCAEGEALVDARVRVEGPSDYTKITHYNGYATFTLYHGEYTITASHEDYGEKEQKVYVYAGKTKTVSICLPGDCDPGYTGEFRCFGDYVQRQYTETDCTKHWKIFEYCPYGCIAGSCIPPTGQILTTQKTQAQPTQQSTKPTDVAAALVLLKSKYTVKTCEVENFSFDVINIGSVEATFDLSVTGEGADSVFVPASLTLKPNERKSVLAYAYSCDVGDYPFTITASTTFDGKVESVSANSVLSAGLLGDTFFKTGWATIILACVVIILVLVVWRTKLGIGLRWRRKRTPEFFRGLGIDVIK